MGADITFRNEKEEFYFRDSYNLAELAPIAKLSYWLYGKGGNLTRYKEFFKKMSLIEDKEIEAYVHKLFKKDRKMIASDDTEEYWIKAFKKKRNDIRNHIEIIMSATSCEWSV